MKFLKPSAARLVALAFLLTGVMSIACDRGLIDVTLGRAIVTDAGTTLGYQDARAMAALLRNQKTATTSVFGRVEGLKVATAYLSHVHNAACSTGGGGHYKLDPTIAAADQANEIWLNFTTDDKGRARPSANVAFVAGADAVSIVVHEADATKTRILCIDLVSPQAR